MEDNLVGVLTFSDGFSGSLRASLTAYPRNLLESVSIVGSKGSAVVGGANLDKILVWEFADRRPAPKAAAPTGHLGFYRALAAQMGTGVTSLPTVADGALVVDVARALYESAALGHPVALGENEFARGEERR